MRHINNLRAELLLNALPRFPTHHKRSTPVYELLQVVAREIVQQSTLSDPLHGRINFGPLGEVKFPYVNMGAIDSLDLFGLDEFVILAFYWLNRTTYHRVADIGANLGLHSIIMSRCGWSVTAFEPDPLHVEIFGRNLILNNITSVRLNQMAVSNEDGVKEFVRVKGNTTGSHLAGSKENAYGELERFKVNVASIKGIMRDSHFIKMDVEGHERQILTATTSEDWAETDMMVEVGSSQNAESIFSHLQKIGVHSFPQKIGWKKAKTVKDMPTSYKEGSLFISCREEMNWG